MAFKINTKDRAALDSLVARVQDERDALEDQLAEYNQVVADAVAQLNEKITAYNEAVEAVRANLDDLKNDFRDQFDNKSERWQDGDKGQAVNSWIETLEDVHGDIRDADLRDEHDELDIDSIIEEDLSAVEQLADQPDE
jgi:uncharacterized protein YukE